MNLPLSCGAFSHFDEETLVKKRLVKAQKHGLLIGDNVQNVIGYDFECTQEGVGKCLELNPTDRYVRRKDAPSSIPNVVQN